MSLIKRLELVVLEAVVMAQKEMVRGVQDLTLLMQRQILEVAVVVVLLIMVDILLELEALELLYLDTRQLMSLVIQLQA